MGIQEAYKQLLFQLYGLYDKREAATIAGLVIEYVTGLRKTSRILNKQVLLNKEQQGTLTIFTEQLLQHKPVQYVLHEAWFAGMKFYVDEQVLIPRPETEELVEWVIQENQKSKIKNIRLLDIGTGSGCIAIALKKKWDDICTIAIDISPAALGIAKKNASLSGTEVLFQLFDFLNEESWPQLSGYDIIVSNPPYIKQSESKEMSKHVVEYEPKTALFVPDEDALLFYRKIALFGKGHLSANGKIYMEINEALGKEVSALFQKEGYRTELRKDLMGKDRMLKAFT